MQLNELLKFDDIVIQCHDDPDADAIASGWALYTYLCSEGKRARLIYGGRAPIQKTNLRLMVEKLNIPIEHCEALDSGADLLVTVDCQYGEAHVQKFPAKSVAVIDHHCMGSKLSVELCEIRENYSSCATLIWDMLASEDFDVTRDEALATALYYGLYMDTGRMQELQHPKDRDLRDLLEFYINRSDMARFQNCNMSIDEMNIVARALGNIVYNEEYRFAVAQVEPCDTSVLGIVSDMLIDVDVVDSCIAFCILHGGVRLSVRSCASHTMADDLVQQISKGLGSGGGQQYKAAGYLSETLLDMKIRKELGPLVQLESGVTELLVSRMEDYYRNTDVYTAGSDETPDLTGEHVYRKKRLPVGYVQAADLYPVGTKIIVRMLEGDLPLVIQDDTYLIIGIEGEVYKNDRSYLEAHNDLTDEPYPFHGEYAPTLHTAVKTAYQIEQRMNSSLTECAKTAIPKQDSCIYARQITRCTKVFVSWSERYMLGNPGDWLVARKENPKDIYIVQKDIFAKSYDPVEVSEPFATLAPQDILQKMLASFQSDAVLPPRSKTSQQVSRMTSQEALEELRKNIESDHPGGSADIQAFADELRQVIEARYPQAHGESVEDDGSKVCVYISPDRMTAYACVLPPASGADGMDREQLIRDIRETYHVTQVSEGALDNAEFLHIIPIARGIPAVDGTDGSLVELFPRQKKLVLGTGANEFPDFSEELVPQAVQRGTVICRMQQYVQGQMGVNVLGEAIECRQVFPPILPGGDNTVISPNGTMLLAAVDGILYTENDRFCVQPMQVIPGELSGKHLPDGILSSISGLFINGDICNDAVVESVGDIIITGRVRDARISSKNGNIRIQGGVFGQYERTVIDAGGSVQAKLVQHAKVKAKHNIVVGSALVSELDCGDIIRVENNISACEINSAQRVICGRISGKTKKSTIHLGCGSELEIRLERIERELSETRRIRDYLWINVDRLLAEKTQYNETQKAALEELIAQRELYEERIRQLQAEVYKLSYELQRRGDSCIHCEELEPVIEVSIGKQKELFTQSTRRCNIRMKEGQIVDVNRG